jgi:N-acetylmuramoyl-L-alanine amidase
VIAEICLALTIYWEARNQSIETQLAIGQVVMNRTDHPDFPNNVCEVVYEGPHRHNFPVRDKCQFKWYCDGKSDRPQEAESWTQAQTLARLIIKVHPMKMVSLPSDALYFHSHTWDAFPNKSYINTIGAFHFYSARN